MLDLALAVRSTGADVISILSGVLCNNALRVSDLQLRFSNVTADADAVGPGSLYVDLNGDQTLIAALMNGAQACLTSSPPHAMVERSFTPGRDAYFLLVPQVSRALQLLAAEWRRDSNIRVIAVSGSTGTESITRAVARATQSVPITVAPDAEDAPASLALAFLAGLPTPSAVLDLGVRDSATMVHLAAIAGASVAVISCIGPRPGGDSSRVARATSRLVESLPAGGLAILNGDDPWTRAMASTSGIARTALFGVSGACDYRAEHLDCHGDGLVSFRLRTPCGMSTVGPARGGMQTVYASLATAALSAAPSGEA